MIDAQNRFSNQQALTATAISNVIDLGPLGGAAPNTIRDIGAGTPLYLFVKVDEMLDSAAEGASLTATLESDDDAGLGSASVHWSSGSIAEATLNAGAWIAKGVPIPAADYQRYLGMRYTVAGENFTSGKISAWLSNTRFDERTYESGFTTGVN